MKLIYKGKFSGNPEDIPHGEHKPNAVAFKEPQDMKTFAIYMNIASLVLTVLCLIPVIVFGRQALNDSPFQFIAGAIIPMLLLFPHEILHAVCFKDVVYLYTNIKQGMLFVTGPEDMSKSRFIFMSLLPNIMFGFIPFAVWLIFPELVFFGVMGALCIGSGVGDYLNVINAAYQMPKGAKTYIHSFHSFWYMPYSAENQG